MITNWPFLNPPRSAPQRSRHCLLRWVEHLGDRSLQRKTGDVHPSTQGGKMDDQTATLEKKREQLVTEAKMADGRQQLFLYKELWAIEETLIRID